MDSGFYKDAEHALRHFISLFSCWDVMNNHLSGISVGRGISSGTKPNLRDEQQEEIFTKKKWASYSKFRTWQRLKLTQCHRFVLHDLPCFNLPGWTTQLRSSCPATRPAYDAVSSERNLGTMRRADHSAGAKENAMYKANLPRGLIDSVQVL